MDYYGRKDLQSSTTQEQLAALLPLKDTTEKRNGEINRSTISVTSPEFREFPLNPQSSALVTVDRTEEPTCRICQDTKNGRGKRRLVAPCGCKGSTKYVHKKCLQKWCATKKTTDCEICHRPYHPRYLRTPRLSQSDENAIVSSTMVLCLLLGVFLASLYLLFAHLSAVRFHLTGDSWLLLFLAIGSSFGVCCFFYWFIKNLNRIMKKRRTLLEEIRGTDPVPLSIISTST